MDTMDSMDAMDHSESRYKLKRQLDELFREGERQRTEDRRTLVSLRAKMTPLKRRLEKQGGSFQLSTYQQQVCRAFASSSGDDQTDPDPNPNHMPAPSVLKIQAQLCHALHCHEVQLRQMNVMIKWNKRAAKDLQQEVDSLTEQKKIREDQLNQSIYQTSLGNGKFQKQLEIKVQNLQEEIQKLRENLDAKADEKENKNHDVIHKIELLMSTVEKRGSYVLPPNLERMETPNILKHSKIWADLHKDELEEQDVNSNPSQGSAGEFRKSSHHFSRSTHYRTMVDSSGHSKLETRSDRMNRNTNTSTNTSTITGNGSSGAHLMSNNSSRGRTSGSSFLMGSLGASLSNFMGGLNVKEDEDDDDDDDGFSTEHATMNNSSSTPTPRASTSTSTSTNTNTNTNRSSGRLQSIRDMILQTDEGAPSSPTSEALKLLSEEVFSF